VAINSIKFREAPLTYQIRVATALDHHAISALLLPLIEKFIAPDCSAEGTALLLGSMQPQAILGYLHGDYRYWLAEDAEGMLGVVAIKGSNHLYHLFVAERAQGQGLARKLWQHALAQCTERDEPDEFTVNASLYAQSMYQHFGFVAEQGPRERMGITDVPMRLILRSRFQGDGQP
jgi:GNAT superfamily N-acetyltransferase